jgi:hypothetical protein
MKQFIRLIQYGWLLDYHIKKKDKFNMTNHKTVLQYHYEMAQYYYENIYGKPFS